MDHGHDPVQFRAVKTVSKGKLKAQMLAYFREVEATGEPLIVTEHGRAALEVRPATPKRGTKNPRGGTSSPGQTSRLD